jgi:hypothetical protein
VKVQDEEQNVAKFLQITEFLYAEKVLYLFTRKNSPVVFSMMMSATRNYLAGEGEAGLLLHELQLTSQNQGEKKPSLFWGGNAATYTT